MSFIAITSMATLLSEAASKLSLIFIGRIFAVAIVIAVSILCGSTIFRRAWKLRNTGRGGLSRPPGPTSWPLIGNLLALGTLPHQALSKLSQIYGPLMYLRLGSVQTIVVSSPKMALEILNTHDKVFASRPRLASCEIMGYGSQNFGFLPYGNEWRHARKLFSSKLMTAKRIEDTQQIRKEEMFYMLQSVLEQSEGGKEGVGMFNHFFQLTTNILTRLLMSKRCFASTKADKSMQEFLENVKETARLFGVFNVGDFIPALKRFDLQGYEKDMKAVHKKMDAFFQGLLDNRRQQMRLGETNEATDLLGVLLTQSDDASGKPMSDNQIKAMLLDILFAGTDTTAMTLEWALAELLKSPTDLERCQRELDAVVGRARLVGESDLPHLPYVLSVVKETLRLHPVGALMLPHQSTEDCAIRGYSIPAQSRAIVNVWAIMRDPSVWERPLEFDPQRFLEHQVKVDGQQDLKWLPFGHGRRSCPGQNLALRVIQGTLALMLQCCDWQLPHSSDPNDMTERFALGVSKAVRLEAIATPRLPTSMLYSKDVVL